jgi:UDP-glucose 4-epimerase
MKIFVTGGAGYIGSHVVKALGEAGHEVLVYDNLSTGHEWAVLCGQLVRGDLASMIQLDEALRSFRPDLVMHFAALIQVEESIREPERYYRSNVDGSLNLLRVMLANGVTRLVFSSTAAVYGIPERLPVDEDAPLKPINPYGITKVTVEKELANLHASGRLRYVALRYFNAAGADPKGRTGQAYPEATHLITRALKVAKGEVPRLQVFGTDYPTPDGTCIRDYIHVDDIARAHCLAMEHLMDRGESRVYNCGYGHGYSVREVVDAVRRVTTEEMAIEESGRRPGDPPALVSDSARIRRELGWVPQHDDLVFIVSTAWEWERRLGGGNLPRTIRPRPEGGDGLRPT